MSKVFISKSRSRLDVFLTSMFTGDLSRVEVQELIKNGKVFVNNECVKKTSFKLKGEEKVSVDIDDFNSSSKKDTSFIKPKKMEIDIIFENENLIIINKPIGLTVHPGAGNVSDTLVNGLLALQKDNGLNLSDIRGNDRLGIVHRLDKDTSGLMIIAKNNKAHRLLGEMIKMHTIDRRYLAIVHGIPIQTSGKIESYICRDKKCIQKMKVCLEDDVGAKLAITNYRVLKIIENGKYSIVECKLETGRTHQIRVHMQLIKHPIIGEQIYTTNHLRQEDKRFGFSRQMLHSYMLNFIEPITKETIMLKKLPDWPLIENIKNDLI